MLAPPVYRLIPSSPARICLWSSCAAAVAALAWAIAHLREFWAVAVWLALSGVMILATQRRIAAQQRTHRGAFTLERNGRVCWSVSRAPMRVHDEGTLVLNTAATHWHGHIRDAGAQIQIRVTSPLATAGAMRMPFWSRNGPDPGEVVVLRFRRADMSDGHWRALCRCIATGPLSGWRG